MSIPIGICYGFEVMRISESPNIPFTCIFERFKKGNDNLITASCDTWFILLHAAPATIIYDNCCNLHQYCLNREPLFFQESWFIIDRFHWPNHSGKRDLQTKVSMLSVIVTMRWVAICH